MTKKESANDASIRVVLSLDLRERFKAFCYFNRSTCNRVLERFIRESVESDHRLDDMKSENAQP